jgi:hypothetical protein
MKEGVVMKSRAIRLTVVAVLAMLVVPAFAGAKTARSVYLVKGGWSASVHHTGLCLETLTCPTVSNSQHGYFLSTKVGSLTGVGATSSGAFVSRAFQYRGAAGRRAGNLVLSLGRYANTASLLSVAGNSARYTVDIVGAKSGTSVAEPIHNAPLSNTPVWTRVSKRVVPASSLQVGRAYRVAITSTFKNGADVIPGATADYRKIKLVAQKQLRRRHH